MLNWVGTCNWNNKIPNRGLRGFGTSKKTRGSRFKEDFNLQIHLHLTFFGAKGF
jgi:hypothetical protein